MATIIVRKHGYVVQFYLNKKRRSICLSRKYARCDVEEIARFVDKIKISVELETAPDRKTLAWLENLPSELKVKFAKTGLVILSVSKTLGDVIDYYLTSSEYRALKIRTRLSKESAIKRITSFIDRSKTVDNLSKRDVQDLIEYLNGRYAEATVAGSIRDINRIFNYAVDNEYIEKNPFRGVSKGSFENKEREVYIDLESFDRILAACSSQTMKSLLTLYRIGGLRLSEGLSVRRQDVDLEKGILTVRSSKTEKFRGRDKRIVPLFPRLRGALVAILETTTDELLFPIGKTTVYKNLQRAVERAGVKKYPRLIQNLRSSRAIEIYRDYGAIAEREWIGHTEQTAIRHYLHVLDADFQRAIEQE